MARRKAPKAPTPIRPSDPGLVLMGDVRQAPVEVRKGNRTFSPVVALWVRAEDGYVVGQLLDEPGHPAQTLVQALRQAPPVTGQPRPPALPSQVILFDEELAKQVRPMLAPVNVTVTVAPPFKPFDDLFTELFTLLQERCQGWPLPDVPDDILRPLISAAERLWRAKPWEYAFDYPSFALVPGNGNSRPLFASVLGAREEVFGLVLYTSIEDYEAALVLGESSLWPEEDESPEKSEAAATDVLQAMRHRGFLVSFEPKSEVHTAYREQLAHGGWPRRLSVVPTFAAIGGGQEPSPLDTQEAEDVTLAVEALVKFCQRHRKQIADEQFPIRDRIEVSVAGKSVHFDVTVPGEDPSAPPATVYRFKVSLTYQKDVWRTIDVRSDQTLVDLHYAIQDAFGWDDDHLYAFYLSGKAWDASTEYIRPEGWNPGQRSARVRLDRLGLRPRKRFLYIFDFGDEWRHDVRVEKAGLSPDGGEYPRIVERHGEAPPQYGDEEEDYEEDE